MISALVRTAKGLDVRRIAAGSPGIADREWREPQIPPTATPIQFVKCVRCGVYLPVQRCSERMAGTRSGGFCPDCSQKALAEIEQPDRRQAFKASRRSMGALFAQRPPPPKIFDAASRPKRRRTSSPGVKRSDAQPGSLRAASSERSTASVRPAASRGEESPA